VRFTRKGDSLYVVFLNRPNRNALIVPSVHAPDGTAVQILGMMSKPSISQRDKDLVIKVQEPLPESYALVAKVTPPSSPLA
jgi:hypothetical protein